MEVCSCHTPNTICQKHRIDKTKLRRVCYIPATGWVAGKGHRVAFVTEDEAGFIWTGDTPEGGKVEPWYWGSKIDAGKSYAEAEKVADEYNLKLGIDRSAAMDVVWSSMRKG